MNEWINKWKNLWFSFDSVQRRFNFNSDSRIFLWKNRWLGALDPESARGKGEDIEFCALRIEFLKELWDDNGVEGDRGLLKNRKKKKKKI